MTASRKLRAVKKPNEPFRPRIFISYSHKDSEALETLNVHLAQLKREGIDIWFDREILPGDKIDREIPKELKKAHIFVALASPAYIHSPYCYEKEYQFALRKAGRKKLHVVVALLHTCQWKRTRMALYKLLPEDGKPVDEWKPQGKAYEDIVEGIRRVVMAVRGEQVQRHGKAKPSKPRSEPAGDKPLKTVAKRNAVSRSAILQKAGSSAAARANKPEAKPKSTQSSRKRTANKKPRTLQP